MSFENFWLLYPNKKEKLYAKKCYDAAIRNGATHEEIITGVKSYIKWLNQADGTTWRPSPKNPSSFLNKGCWLDEYEDQAQSAPACSPEESRRKARIAAFNSNGIWNEEWGEKPKLENDNVVQFKLFG